MHTNLLDQAISRLTTGLTSPRLSGRRGRSSGTTCRFWRSRFEIYDNETLFRRRRPRGTTWCLRTRLPEIYDLLAQLCRVLRHHLRLRYPMVALCKEEHRLQLAVRHHLRLRYLMVAPRNREHRLKHVLSLRNHTRSSLLVCPRGQSHMPWFIRRFRSRRLWVCH